MSGFIKKYFKILLPVALLMVIGVGIIVVEIQNDNFFKSPYGENYAYKDITGYNSEYLIPWERDKYVVDIDLTVREEVQEEVQTSSNGTPVDELDINDPEYMGYEADPNAPKGPNSVLETLDRSDLKLADVANDVFSNIGLIEGKWSVEKGIEDTESNVHTKRDAEKIKGQVGRLIEGTFNWSYKDDGNKVDFLAYRVGQYVYDNRLVSTHLVYERKYKKIKDNNVIITPEYDSEMAKVYLHPEIGGYIVDVPVKLNIKQGSEELVEEFRYIARLGFRAPSPADIWELWETNDNGVFMIGEEYLIKE